MSTLAMTVPLPLHLDQARPGYLRYLAAAFLVSTFVENLSFASIRLVANAPSVVGLLLVGAYLLWSLTRDLRLTRTNLLFASFLAVTLITGAVKGVFLGDLGNHEPRLYMRNVQLVVIYVIVFDICRDLRTIRLMAVAFVIAVAVMSLLALLQVEGASTMARSGRAGVATLNLNRQAFFYTQCIIGIYCWLLVRWPRIGWSDVALAGVALPCVLALVNTASRSGAAVLLFGLGIGGLLLLRRHNLSAYVLLVPAVLIMVGSALLGSELLQRRVEQAMEGRTGLRAELLAGSSSMIADRPFTGWGPAYGEELNQRIERESGGRISAHNTYTQLLVSYGLFGFLPWLAGVIATLALAWRTRSSPWSSILLTLLLCALFSASAIGVAYLKYIWLLLAATGGAATAGLSLQRWQRSDPYPRPALCQQRIEEHTGAKSTAFWNNHVLCS